MTTDATATATSPDKVDAGGVERYLRSLQRRIVDALQAIDGGRFAVDDWRKAEDQPLTGFGSTAILEDGAVLERAGVGFSHVAGASMPPSATQVRPELAGRRFDAMGVLARLPSPQSARAHRASQRALLRRTRGRPAGRVVVRPAGMDLTPAYGYDEDAVHFHRTCRDALTRVRHGPASPLQGTLRPLFLHPASQ